MKKITSIIYSAIAIFLLFSCSEQPIIQPTSPQPPSTGGTTNSINNTFFLGHSLINFDMPNMVQKLSQAASQPFSYQSNIANGANLEMHWNNPHSAGSQGSYWDTTLDNGGFDNFIITEAVPLKNHTRYSNTYRYANHFYDYAKSYNSNIKYYLYETWHCINTGTSTGCDWDEDDHLTWRQRLTADLPLWESIADSVNRIHGNNTMLIIPAGQALARLHDQVITGQVPGITTIRSLFTDDIHLNHTGNYFIACVMYAVLNNRSPEGLPNQLTDNYNIPYSSYPTEAQAQKFQQIAWQTVRSYSRSGVH